MPQTMLAYFLQAVVQFSTESALSKVFPKNENPISQIVQSLLIANTSKLLSAAVWLKPSFLLSNTATSLKLHYSRFHRYSQNNLILTRLLHLLP